MHRKAHVTVSVAPGEHVVVEPGDKLKKGTPIVKPKADEIDEFNLAKLLGVAPGAIKKHLTVSDKSPVTKGQPIAIKKGLFKSQIVKTPSQGEFVIIDEEKGMVGVVRHHKGIEKVSLTEAVVFKVEDDKVILEVSGFVLEAKEGKGAFVTGVLKMAPHATAVTMPIEIDEHILVVKDAKSDLIAKADALGAKAIIAEMIEQPPFSLPFLVVSEIETLAKHHEKHVIVLGDEKQLLIVE